MDASTKRALVHRYRSGAAIGGACIGVLVGLLIAGPRVHGDSMSPLMLVGWIAGPAVVLGAAGYYFVEVFISYWIANPSSPASSSARGGGNSGIGHDGDGDAGDP
jgi:hypothetical protein